MENYNMDEIVTTLRKSFAGYGHLKVSIEVDGEQYDMTTDDMLTTDAAFDNGYDLEDNSGRYYQTQREAQEKLVKDILKLNELI